MRLSAKFLSALLVLAGTVSAQIAIIDVVNAGSRLGKASALSGIAQGSIFVVTGRNIGPADFLQATFPLPTTDGLGGVSVQATVSGAIVDCIMVYVQLNQVAAILPSQTPLGVGTIRVNNNGASVTAPITVVAAAFGIFTTRDGFGVGPAVAFNVSADDGSTTPNTLKQSVQPGQDAVIAGTGLGAIGSDETQPGATDVPTTTIQVYVGVKPATVVSAGRGTCCDGLDPSYRIPLGTAGWDVIRFTIPEGVVGCFMPVVVQIGNFVSNLATISIDPSGADCTPPVSTLPQEVIDKLAGKIGVSIGNLNLGRGIGINPTAAGGTTITKRDTGSAAFVRYPNLPASMVAIEYLYPENVCSINNYPGPTGGVVVNGTEVTIVPLAAVALDAGPSLMVKGPSGTRTITKRTVGMLFDYQGVTFGDTTPGNYFDPGRYTVTGSSGKDIGAITASIDVPSTPFVWTGIPSVTTPMDRSKDLTITWTGGIPGTQVTVLGAGFGGGVTSAFLCAAPVGAGQLTIPSYVLLTVPPTGTSIVPGSLAVQNRIVSAFTVSGLDLSSIAYGTGYSLSLKFQ